MTGDEELARSYAEAGFRQPLDLGRRPALLVVDFVNAYVTPGSPLYAAGEHAIEPGSRVLLAARAAAVPVVYTRVVYHAEGRDGGLFLRKIRALELFVGNGKPGQIVSALTPRADELVIEKQYASAFFGTSLAATLTSAGCDTAIIIGFSTSGCVRATAVDAMQHGFVPVVVADAVADRDPRPHEQALFDIEGKYGEIRSCSEATTYLAELAGNEAGGELP